MANSSLWTDAWSFMEALGDTIMEKYESLYVKLHEMFETLGGPDRVICGPEVASVFETATCGFEPEPWHPDVDYSTIEFYKVGRINNRFDIYLDRSLTNYVYVCGRTDTQRLTVEDFIF